MDYYYYYLIIVTKDMTKSLAAFPINYPVIKPVEKELYRPFWSVMIPTYNRIQYLEKTINSVLTQGYSSDEMQIEVIDNCSTEVDIEKIVKKISNNRVSFYQQPQNLGMTGNWNTCLNRARGRWIHILHDDDFVLPGFYRRLQVGIEQNPTIGLAFCRYIFMDEEGHWQSLSPLESRTPSILNNWLERIVVESAIYTPAVVVKREVYEQVGGFCAEAYSATDWEMWKRIAVNYPVWYEPQPLACYRRHSASYTDDLMKSARNFTDVRRAIDISQYYLPIDIAVKLSNKARKNYALCAINLAEYNIAIGRIDISIAQIREGLLCNHSVNMLLKVTYLLIWGLARWFWHGLVKWLFLKCKNTINLITNQKS